MGDRLSRLLALVALLLGGIVLAELGTAPGTRDTAVPAPRAPAASDAGAPAFDLASTRAPIPALESLTQTVARPLFSRDRKPGVAASATVDVAPTRVASAPNLGLIGVVIVDGEPVALVENRAERRTLRLREGDSLAGWRVQRIEPDRVLLRDGDRVVEVKLRAY